MKSGGSFSGVPEPGGGGATRGGTGPTACCWHRLSEGNTARWKMLGGDFGSFLSRWRSKKTLRGNSRWSPWAEPPVHMWTSLCGSDLKQEPLA